MPLRPPASPGLSRVRRGGSLGKARGVASVAGGVLTHLVLGTLFCWGSFQAYVPESLQFFDGGCERRFGTCTRAHILAIHSWAT